MTCLHDTESLEAAELWLKELNGAIEEIEESRRTKILEEEEGEGDDVCDQCMRSGVEVARTNLKGETICTSCDETYDADHPGEFDELEKE